MSEEDDDSDGKDLGWSGSRAKTESSTYLVLIVGLALSAILMATVIVPTSKKFLGMATAQAPDSGDSETTRVAQAMTVEIMSSYADELFKQVAKSLEKQGPYKFKYLVKTSHNGWFEVGRSRLFQTHNFQRNGDVALFMDEQPRRAVLPSRLSLVEMKGRVLTSPGNEYYCMANKVLINITLLSDTGTIRNANMRLANEELKVHEVTALGCLLIDSYGTEREQEAVGFLKENFRKYLAMFAKERLFKTLFHHVSQVAKKF